MWEVATKLRFVTRFWHIFVPLITACLKCVQFGVISIFTLYLIVLVVNIHSL